MSRLALPRIGLLALIWGSAVFPEKSPEGFPLGVFVIKIVAFVTRFRR